MLDLYLNKEFGLKYRIWKTLGKRFQNVSILIYFVYTINLSNFETPVPN